MNRNAGAQRTAPHVAKALGRAGAVQPFGWAIHEGNDSENSQKIVNENLRLAGARYAVTETVTDPEKIEAPQQPILANQEVIHIHAHGHPGSVASFTPKSLAREIVRKFQAQALVGRTIVLHSCETGREDYGEELLEALTAEADDRGVALDGTRVFAPLGYLVVNDDGKSYVSKVNVDSSKLREKETRGPYLRPLGQGWKGFESVSNQYYQGIRSINALTVKSEILDILDVQEEEREVQYYEKPELAIPGWRDHDPNMSWEEALEYRAWVERETAPVPHKDLDDEGKVNDFFGIFAYAKI
jgi:hypothetical protein